MTIHLSYTSKGDVSNIGKCIPLIVKEGVSNFNITVDAADVFNHWEEFQKALFVADLLCLNGFFILGELDESLEEKIKTLYSKSVFSFFKKVIYSKEENNFPKRNRKASKIPIESELNNQVRTIIVWDGKRVLKPETKLEIEFWDGKRKGEVKQIQKVINTDFNGSMFGVNRLEKGGIATIALVLDQQLEKVYFEDSQSKGLFTIVNDNNIQIGYGIIIR